MGMSMDELKLGDIIKCTNMEELSVTEEELVNAGYGFITSYDMITMTWKIKITAKYAQKETADDQQGEI